MKAPVLAIAVGKPKGPVGGDEDDGDERESFDAFRAALKANDDDTAYEALRSMIETCAAKIKEGSYGAGED